MAIPKYHEFMLPLLNLAESQQELNFRDAVNRLAAQFQLSEAELKERLPSGQQAIVDNRVGWAKTYLVKAGLLQSTGRGTFKITPQGIDFLKTAPPAIDVSALQSFSKFTDFYGRGSSEEAGIPNTTSQLDLESTPEESIESGYHKIRSALELELLQKIKNCSPQFFENLVVELLLKMGYGGSRKDAGQAIGRSGDGGIDGIIKEDRLGLDSVYVQAKRWDGTTVGRPEIQKFAGALQMHRARKGVFITTSRFSDEAQDYTSRIDSKIVLIDGVELMQLLVDHNIGVATEKVYELKRIDSDYFVED